MYWAMTLKTKTIASRREAKAKDPKWYLKAQPRLWESGLEFSLSDLPKYQIDEAQASTNSLMASRKERFQTREKK